MTQNQLDLVGLVSGFVRLRDSAFPDLRLTESAGTIEITDALRAVTTLRFELPGTEFLHLATVIIDADGLDDPVRQTTRTMSSVWKDFDQTLERGTLFDPADHGKGFHTRKESLPWMEIAFDRPRDISRIRIVNCEGPNSVRARGLVVSVHTEDGRRHTVYDGLARERAFLHAAERYANGEPTTTGRTGTRRGIIGNRAGLPAHPANLVEAVEAAAGTARSLLPGRHPARSVNPLVPGLVRVMTMIALQDDTAVRWALQRLALSPQDAARFRTEVNRHLLFPRERELTSHGVRRSFRFWTAQQRQDYLEFALEVIAALRELTPDVCFGFGSALAIIRDHEPIPHDDDLDVLIGFEPGRAATHAEGRQLVRDCLTAHGFKVSGGMTAYQWVTRSTGGTRLDVFIGVFEGDDISWYPGKRAALTRDMMFPPTEREFLGRTCPVPARPETYLEQIYGPGWEVPDPGFAHRWDPGQYADIAGA